MVQPAGPSDQPHPFQRGGRGAAHGLPPHPRQPLGRHSPPLPRPHRQRRQEPLARHDGPPLPPPLQTQPPPNNNNNLQGGASPQPPTPNYLFCRCRQ
ncbi:unnamed protein product [Linum tenue]|uniref:Uncharacterized protein n=1 Tax=Linum tenue TaxID=586396 RepID=A0AAV0IRJ8_9ROSI|nr:unnamed protein product [Linum tenue]